ncbi:LPS-assembly lipoprotein [Pseudoxanthomonas sp. CF385]|uniref:LPS-assembly lipoprotein LptE n=1 Tax=Pseudoxanthomonas sp. CF385 TaxID=1881042 RepID=UPI000887A6BE|nr:LPS assembly lipoprotein LptE [Pseudoxanthomonas sp. CF385]SDQ91875.1 LPS-assembly lipoprotein [Pseudoxanthomonas sp. CF385]
MTRFRLPMLLAALVLLAGCGFHLRNQIALPADLGPVRVVGSTTSYSALVTSLSRGLQAAGATLAAPIGENEDIAAGEQVATLRVVSERWGDLPIAVDQFGRAQEFSLRYAVVFAFTKADGTDLVPQQVVELSRDYVSPPQDATGTTTEREVLAEELRREMAASILRRVDGVVRSGPVNAAP